MNKRIEGKDRLGEGGAQQGDIGSASDSRQQQQQQQGSGEPGGDIGVGGQRHEGGSSRDPESQGRRTKEERHG